jgi:hypothetical protein
VHFLFLLVWERGEGGWRIGSCPRQGSALPQYRDEVQDLIDLRVRHQLDPIQHLAEGMGLLLREAGDLGL